MLKANASSKTTVACVKVNGGTQLGCTNTPAFQIPVITGGTAKIPVTLAELTLQVNVDSMITLPEPAVEIKDIKKRVKVTQCLLLLPTNVLFIKGFIRKNIDYATGESSNKVGICGDIRHCTVDVPFRCTTTVNSFDNPPVTPVSNTSQEFTFFKKQQLTEPGFGEKYKLLSSDTSESNMVSQEFFNELPYCELISARLVEYNEFLNRSLLVGVDQPFEERVFRHVEEKMILSLTLKILQNQQLTIPPCDLNNFGCLDFSCTEFNCVEPFVCQTNEFDCDIEFGCLAIDTFTCGDIFNCGKFFGCADFNCEDPFTCGFPFGCDIDFSCTPENNFECSAFSPPCTSFSPPAL